MTDELQQATAGEEEQTGPTAQEILAPIWQNKKKIFLVSFIVGLVTLGINFLLPVYFKSTATLLPETQKDKLSSLGQFADIANLAGVNVPGSEIARLYPVILNSETILTSVISKRYRTSTSVDSADLIQYLDVGGDNRAERMARAVTQLRTLTEASYDNKTGVVSINLEMPDPVLAANVLNSMIGELDEFMRTKRHTNASEQVKWIDTRLSQVSAALKQAEDTLKVFSERNRQISASPHLLLKQERLTRTVHVNSTIYVELKKQYELAKLEEIKNTNLVNVLDPATIPIKKERPKRLQNTASIFVLMILGCSTFFAFKNQMFAFKERFFQNLNRPT